MNLTDIKTQLTNLKSILPSIISLAEDAEGFFNSEQKAALEKAVNALKAIPVVEMEGIVSQAYDKLQTDVKLTKTQLLAAGAAIALLVHLLHKKN